VGLGGRPPIGPGLRRPELARLVGDEVRRQRELREAHGLFTEMGATARAKQVVRQLNSLSTVTG
jgi:hypothetical protein